VLGRGVEGFFNRLLCFNPNGRGSASAMDTGDGWGRPCESCGRRVALDYDDLPYDEPRPSRPTSMRHDFCSEVSAYRYYNRIRNERAAAARAGRVCQECGRGFDAVRSDQRYCSAACKQRAYRQRLKA
jgi:hypothetical protein